MKTILFYAALSDMSYFSNHSFYSNTKEVLEKAGYNVIPSINMADAWHKDYDGILCFFYRHGVIPATLAKLRRKKVIFTGGTDNLDKEYAPLKSWLLQVVLFKLCRWLADCCLVESHSDLTNMKKVCLHKNPKNLHYCPQAMALEKYRCNLNEKERTFSTICWQGRIENVKRKGVDKALYYFKYLTQYPEFVDYRFNIIGRTGEGTPYLKKLIKELKLDNQVKIIGPVTESEKLDMLKKTKYFFQLSEYEGFGLAALEAAAAGCIPIHTGKGGLADVYANDGVCVNSGHTLADIDKTVYNRLLKIGNIDIEKMLKRIHSMFDEPIRVNNFRRYLQLIFD